MSEFDLNPEEPNFEDINASLAGNFSQKDEENKLDGYNNFSTIAQISTGADSELLQEKKEESQKEINDGFIKINKIGEIKVEEPIEDKTSIKIEEEKEDAKVKETEQIKIDDNLNKNDKTCKKMKEIIKIYLILIVK